MRGSRCELTHPHLIQEWRMNNDFKPIVDQPFTRRGDWGAVDCQVAQVEPNKMLSYTWAAMGLESVVPGTLSATTTEVRLHMQQTGFRPDPIHSFARLRLLVNLTTLERLIRM